MLNRRGLIFGLAACPLCTAAARAGDGAHWSYEGPDGPQNWGSLDPAYRACGVGGQQSPIDIAGDVPAFVPRPQVFWRPEAYEIVNNGHTIQANVKDEGRLILGKERFAFKQFHFHTPSEHALRSKRFEMEAHFVHQHSSGRLAVLGAFLIPGGRNAAFAQIMKAAPQQKGEAKLAKAVAASSLLPKERSFFRYEGSLTTPPCDETVDWIVFKTPVRVAQTDIDAFRNIFAMNARPLQSVNRRFLLKR